MSVSFFKASLQASSRKGRPPHSEWRRTGGPLLQKVVQRTFQHGSQRRSVLGGVAFDFFKQTIVQFHRRFHAIHPYFSILADGYFNRVSGNPPMTTRG